MAQLLAALGANYFFALMVVFLSMLAWYVISIPLKRNDVADVAWGLGFVSVAVLTYAYGDVLTLRATLVTLAVTIWGFRLSTHIATRLLTHGEDRRYYTWRQTWGRWFYLRSFFQVFMLQGALLLLVVSPVIISNSYAGAPFSWLDAVGFLVWLIGFFFEATADAQLRKFLRTPGHEGHLMQRGLWRYSRHPNYFGEVTQWWGLWIVALSVPFGILGIVGPVTITLLILFVSGIPLLEQKMQHNPEFADYAARTSVFIPWFVR